MKGGELELLGPKSEADDETDEVTGEDGLAEALETIVPTENKHAEFRGDSYHRVRAYET